MGNVGTMGPMKIAISGKRGKMGAALRSLIDDTPLESADVIIDFSTPERVERAIEEALAYNLPLVSGTTGIDRALFTEASTKIPIMHASNFSLGIALMREALPLFAPHGTPTITEIHHPEKKDTPSGTSLDIARDLGGAKIIAKRIPDAQAEVSVSFMMDDEEIVITHKAKARTLFAKGALLAAQSLIGKPPGLYNFVPSLYNKMHESSAV